METQAALLLSYLEDGWETAERLQQQIASLVQEAAPSEKDTVVLGYETVW